MFLSEWREFPSAPCLAGKKKLDDSSRSDVVEIARIPDMLPSFLSYLVGLRTYQHPSIIDHSHRPSFDGTYFICIFIYFL